MNAINTVLSRATKEANLSLPHQLKAKLPLNKTLMQQIAQHRQVINNILAGNDPRLLVIIGPCSIHDPAAALDYAARLKKLQQQCASEIFFVMRAYIEKPRTTVGWKGFLYDPHLDGSSDLESGLQLSRQLYLDIIEMGLPIASEILNPMATGYFDDLLAWGAIGARTSESQIHREISSHLPYSIGFKNGTDGSIQIALDAIQSAQHSHQFLGLNTQGLPSVIHSQGNPLPHLILRGSNQGTNFDAHSILQMKQQHGKKFPACVVDCSHGNSGKDPQRQPEVLQQIIAERQHTQVRGVMLESHLIDGQQKISDQMCYGQSITDGCLGWEKTEQLMRLIATSLKLQQCEKMSA